MRPLIVTPSASSSYSAVQRFNGPNLLLPQPIQLIHQRINLDHEVHERARKPRNSLSCLSPPFAPFVVQTSSTIVISSSPNPYNSYTSASICRFVASARGLCFQTASKSDTSLPASRLLCAVFHSLITFRPQSQSLEDGLRSPLQSHSRNDIPRLMEARLVYHVKCDNRRSAFL